MLTSDFSSSSLRVYVSGWHQRYKTEVCFTSGWQEEKENLPIIERAIFLLDNEIVISLSRSLAFVYIELTTLLKERERQRNLWTIG